MSRIVVAGVVERVHCWEAVTRTTDPVGGNKYEGQV